VSTSTPSFSTLVVLMVLVASGLWAWQRRSVGLAVVFALLAGLPAYALAKRLSWPVLVLVGLVVPGAPRRARAGSPLPHGRYAAMWNAASYPSCPRTSS
jgi:hypothetical protein